MWLLLILIVAAILAIVFFYPQIMSAMRKKTPTPEKYSVRAQSSSNAQTYNL